MSNETIVWLNSNVLMGFTDDRAKWAGQGFAIATGDGVKPWFATDEYEGGFTGPVPVEAVAELFGWEAIARPLWIDMPCELHEADGVDADGLPTRRVQVEGRQAVARGDNGFVMNVTSDNYRIHQYEPWLVENVGGILDDDVQIDSAGLLMGGGVAWVSVSLPEAVTTKADFAMRPRILAFTSHNGRHATTYMRSIEAPVCDNSLSIEVARGNDQRVRIKHTSQSHLVLSDARQALAILHQQSDDMVAFMDALAEWEVTNQEFAKLLNRLEPMPEQVIEGGKVKNQRALTMADTRRQSIVGLYLGDDRVTPWKGTALGVLQAFNTFDQQVRAVQGERVERKLLNTLSGEVDKFDGIVLNQLADVAERDLRELVPA